jgi:hypothetical protein
MTMLNKFVRTILVAVTLTGGAIAAVPAAVAAPIGIAATTTESGNVLLVQRYDRDDRRDRRDRHDRRDRRDRYERGGCSNRDALRKASRMGINRAGIVRDNRRAVVVDGRKRGRYISVSFAQARGCPVINVR